ncbi:TrkH family potassium uptake protein [Kistimonas asteriae]|uniref:TrkH family potassium uptake protein n=1 Tax=Kistimonas asteriae TaxID=517724 RepID=UPI001BA93FB1|nr:TrkH family potassium uptake protein [Kistimonas asteriae]
MNIKPVLYVAGLFLMVLGILMLIPALLTLSMGDIGAGAFFESAIYTFLSGGLLAMLMRSRHFSLVSRQIFLLTNVSWILVSAFAALPFVLVEDMSYTDAFFETMSGITTTGSTVMSHLTTVNGGILLWRSILQWLGGIGFIVMAVAILPFLKVGGMRLFQSESSDWSEKALPRSGSIAKRIVLVYSIITILCMVGYLLSGMNLFDAANHAMTTVSTGGYSTSDASMGHFSNPWVHWNATLFMILGSLPFVLFVRFLRGDRASLLRDSQVQAFIGFLVMIWLLFSVWLWLNSSYDWFESLTLVAFNTTSVVTTTGYAMTDYSLWGGFAISLFFFLTFVGGCSGSTAGGIKIFRFQIGFKLLHIQLKQLNHPRAFLVQSYNGIEITNDILRSLVAFSSFFGLLVALLTIGLSLLGLDFVTSLSGAVTAIANVGPGFGDVIGPAGNFATLPAMAKWLLCVGMLMGRLEVITVLVMFLPSFWRN